jgi:8-oxo-dGTP diphosphatase
MDKVVRVGVAVNVERDGKYLLLKRTGVLGTNTWCPPGGKIEFGESIDNCAMREFKEEAGDNIVISKPLFVGITNDFFEKENEHYVTIWMSAYYLDGEPIINEPNKFSDIGWFYPHEMNNMDLFLPVINFINHNENCYMAEED